MTPAQIRNVIIWIVLGYLAVLFYKRVVFSHSIQSEVNIELTKCYDKCDLLKLNEYSSWQDCHDECTSAHTICFSNSESVDYYCKQIKIYFWTSHETRNYKQFCHEKAISNYTKCMENAIDQIVQTIQIEN